MATYTATISKTDMVMGSSRNINDWTFRQLKADYESGSDPYYNMTFVNNPTESVTYPNWGFTLYEFAIPQYATKQITSATIYIYLNYYGSSEANFKLLDAPTISEIMDTKMDVWWRQYKDEVIVESDDYIGRTATTLAQQTYNNWLAVDITNIVASGRGTNAIIGIWGERGAFVGTFKSAYSSLNGHGSTTAEHIPYIVINYADITPADPTIIYPSGDMVQKGTSVTFQWRHNAPGDDGGQTSFELGYRLQGGSTWTTVTQTSTETEYTIDTSAWNSGIYEWRVKTTNAAGLSSGYTSSIFELMGAPNVPVINSIDATAVPTINWYAPELEAALVEFEILSGSTTLYYSGELAGTSERSFVPDCILADGTYIVRLRVGNIYGLYSPWAAQQFTIDTTSTKPSAPDCMVSAGSDTVTITTTYGSYKFIYRSEDNGTPIPIAYNMDSSYIDGSVQPNKVYTYFVRAYLDGAYNDSPKKTAVISFDGFKVSSINDQTNSISFRQNTSNPFHEVSRSFSNESVYWSYVGREYYVKESGQFKTEAFEGSFYLSETDLAKFLEVYRENSVFILRSEKYFMYCDVDVSGISSALLGRGYNITIKCERLSHDDQVHYDELTYYTST